MPDYGGPVPEGGVIPTLSQEEREQQDAMMQKTRAHIVIVRCEKCHKERPITMGELIAAHVHVCIVHQGRHAGHYLLVSCPHCWYPVAREVRTVAG